MSWLEVCVAADPSTGPDRTHADGLFSGGGEAGRLMAAHDWAATSVGPVQEWPASLRYAVRTVLASRFPMVLTWGPEFVQFYNDAYTPFIGAKHPAIGEDIRRTLAEGWAALSGPVEHAMATCEASWLPRLPLLLERAGYREETYFTVSHAPAFGDDGRVAGMHAVCTEVTAEVLGERRQQLLHDLSCTQAHRGDEAAVLAGLCRTLGSDPLDVPFAAVYLDGDGGLRRAGTVGCPPGSLPAHVPDAGALPGPVAGLGLVGGFWQDPVRDAVVLPLGGGAGEERIGVLVAGVSPNRALDAEYRTFLDLVAGQFASGLGTARAFEAERRRAESLAELDRAKTAFFSDVSHELRTPLTLLLGPISDVLADPADPLPPSARDQLELALRNGQRLQRLVDDLMDVASIEAGRAGAVRVPTDLAAFTAELAGVLRAATERAGLRLSVDCPPLDRPVHVDPRMWEKVVLNLLSNAVKYTFVGGIQLVLRGEPDQVVLTVTDTGIGIPADELPRVFDRFHRVQGSLARHREGTGIGLALVRELAGLHGGTVTVASEPGAGSTFTVAVPYGSPDAPADPVAPSSAAHGTAASWVADVTPDELPPAPAGATATVLVVDDNADMRTYLTRLLAPIWRVRTCTDGEEALAAVAEEQPDVVLTDVMMPRVDGFELLRRLRADPATRAIPVIMLTARAGQEAAVEGFTAGVDDYLAKPFRADELIARVRVALQRGSGGSAQLPPGRPEPVAPRAATAPEVRVLVPASRPPVPPRPATAPAVHRERWRFPAVAQSVPALRRALRRLFSTAGLDDDQAYDLLLAACEAATNAVEHAQQPTEPFVDVTAEVTTTEVVVTVRDHGQWRERVPSMDRGRGSTLMGAVGEVTAVPGPEGTTVTIRSPRTSPPPRPGG
ncbi:ATP-binding protein [Modestobacter marinus]|uniref:histidine kinase n=1 Tax=Modestobacter marinus TaxID=477641 RepID=A0A846LKQ0_9ACTN|nr:ATP-binding protein [Modestobacter marinus]NIH67134.1 signal transduction histidine kinase/ActR/RegA family two-component response regulator [Modestobacter marinus]